ncbi:MAG TPA: O-antigen ligase family protein [Thermoanaerobaculia bacterium]|nr:O-antigen ligase family protein [Thermoanaerobaculia bacterium]
MSSAVDEQLPSRRDVTGGVLWLLIAGAALIIPLVVAPTHLDAFRFPKQKTYEAFAIVVAAWLAIAFLFRGREFFEPLRKHRKVLLLTLGVVAWTALTTLTSTNRTLSVQSLVWVTACGVIFVATLLTVEQRGGRLLLWLLFVPATANALLAIVQRARIYNPMVFDERIPDRIRTTALIGNPNDVGTYLLFPVVAAMALALASRSKWLRVAMWAVAAVLTCGILVTVTITAIGALGAATVALLLTRSRRSIVPLVIVAAISAASVAAYAPLRGRVTAIASNIRQGNLIEATSLRLPAYLAAWEMFVDRPLLGKGPGTYSWWYLPYKMELNERNPRFYTVAVNFGETHNDHLQTLAVAGAPGYALFLGGAILLASISFRRRDEREERNENREFARLLGLPLAVGFLVVTLAQFPLELASATRVLLHLAAVCRVWSEEA